MFRLVCAAGGRVRKMLVFLAVGLRDVMFVTKTHVDMCCSSFFRVANNFILDRDDYKGVATV